ncbi:MAG TPA: SMP-30/gluconolactonase/LRE family protein [Gemmatimonadaceae bacterium]|nr:SMP-30/gluconolactonase/LRE family protein [Gemmatimonadaceae bacterium]
MTVRRAPGSDTVIARLVREAVSGALRDSVSAWRRDFLRPTGDTSFAARMARPLLCGVAPALDAPESARWVPARDRFLISVVGGAPAAKDNDGTIAVAMYDGAIEWPKWIQGGHNGVTLHAPKGMWVGGDTLWVTDIDVVRGFHVRTGAPLKTITFPGEAPDFLNDIVGAPDGSLYVTDTGFRFGPDGKPLPPGPGRLYRIANGVATVALDGPQLGQPNGVAWDRDGARLIIAPSASDTLLAWTPGAAAPAPVAVGPGRYDGVEVLPGGRILVTSWKGAAVMLVREGRMVPFATGLTTPADIGYDDGRRVLAVPLLRAGKVNFYTLP